jgi:hypothetical protein
LTKKGHFLLLKGVVLKMTLLAPRLLLRARVQESRFSGDSSGDTGEGTGVQVEKQACQ